MPDAIFNCVNCKKDFKSGCPIYAIRFAASKRGVSEGEIIEEFFESNKRILRKELKKMFFLQSWKTQKNWKIG